jgi:maltose/moltooligosaccharide transporter
MLSTSAELRPQATTTPAARTPYFACLVIGLGGLFAGVTGPLLSNFVPPLVRDALGDHRTAIGGVMAIDNFLLLLLVPWAGAASDRASASGRGRRWLAVYGFLLAALGMVILPPSAKFGIVGLITAIVVLYTGINIQRSPVQALVADVVPSRYRSLAAGSVMFQMCLGAILFLMLGRILGMQTAFMIAAATVLAISVAFAFGLREPDLPGPPEAEATFRSLIDAVLSAVRGEIPGLRTIFVASLLLQMTFQSFTTWFALHGTERFGVTPDEVTLGFIAWAIGGIIGALPAGFIGVRLGRRNAMLLGFALMAASLIALDRVATVGQAAPLLALVSASWTLPMVNAYPLFVEPIPAHRRGVLAALFLLSMALGGAIGDPMNGGIFDLAGSYRSLFLLMGAYTSLAFVAVLFIPRGAGEAGTGPDGAVLNSGRQH